MCVEICCDAPSHYYAASNSFNRIDKWFVSLPPWMITSFKVEIAIVDNPQVMLKTGLSDHSPVLMSLRLAAPKDRRSSSIPPFIFNSHIFARIYAELAD